MTNIEQAVESLRVTKSEVIKAPPEIVWESLIAELGPDGNLMPGQPMNFKLEPHVGGRWYRDLGDGAGHLWGHVQVFKPNKLLELSGPMFMSFAASNHISYKLTADGENTRLDLTHTAIGLIPADIGAGLQGGWGQQLTNVLQRAEKAKR